MISFRVVVAAPATLDGGVGGMSFPGMRRERPEDDAFAGDNVRRRFAGSVLYVSGSSLLARSSDEVRLRSEEEVSCVMVLMSAIQFGLLLLLC